MKVKSLIILSLALSAAALSSCTKHDSAMSGVSDTSSKAQKQVDDAQKQVDDAQKKIDVTKSIINNIEDTENIVN